MHLPHTIAAVQSGLGALVRNTLLPVMQLGEVKRGLKAYKATGATNEDFHRHVMFVQVCQRLPSAPSSSAGVWRMAAHYQCAFDGALGLSTYRCVQLSSRAHAGQTVLTE